MNIKINDIKCDLSDEGFDSSVVASVYYTLDNESKWLHIIETDGIPDFFLSKDDIHGKLIEEGDDIDARIDFLDKYRINKFEGVKFDELSYDNLFEKINSKDIDPLIKKLFRLIILIVRCDYDDLKDLIKKYKTKNLCDIDVPCSDVEEDYNESLN